MRAGETLFAKFLKGETKRTTRTWGVADVLLVTAPVVLGAWLIQKGLAMTRLIDLAQDRFLTGKGSAPEAMEVLRDAQLNGVLLLCVGTVCVCLAVTILAAMRHGVPAMRWPPANLRRNIHISKRINARRADGRAVVIEAYVEIVEEIRHNGVFRVAEGETSYFLASGEPVTRDKEGFYLTLSHERLAV